MSLDLVRQFPTVTTLNLGGGYKVRFTGCAEIGGGERGGKVPSRDSGREGTLLRIPVVL